MCKKCEDAEQPIHCDCECYVAHNRHLGTNIVYCNVCWHVKRMSEAIENPKNVNDVLDEAFEENWKELKEERTGSYKVVDDNLAREAFILFTAGFMSCYEYYVKNKNP